MKITSGQTFLLLAVVAVLLALATARTHEPEALARKPTSHALRAAARQLTPLVQ